MSSAKVGHVERELREAIRYAKGVELSVENDQIIVTASRLVATSAEDAVLHQLRLRMSDRDAESIISHVTWRVTW